MCAQDPENKFWEELEILGPKFAYDGDSGWALVLESESRVYLPAGYTVNGIREEVVTFHRIGDHVSEDISLEVWLATKAQAIDYYLGPEFFTGLLDARVYEPVHIRGQTVIRITGIFDDLAKTPAIVWLVELGGFIVGFHGWDEEEVAYVFSEVLENYPSNSQTVTK